MRRLLRWLYKKITWNYSYINLFGVSINLKKAMKEGSKGNRTLHVHNSLANDPFIRSSLETVADYIEEHYSLMDLLPPE